MKILAFLFVLFLCLNQLQAFKTEQIEALSEQFEQADLQEKPEIALLIAEKYYSPLAEKQEQYLQKGLQIARDINDEHNAFQILLSLANHYKKMGKIDTAIEHVDKAMTIAKKLSNNTSQIEWRQVKANISIHQSKITEAIAILEETLEFAENDKMNTAKIYNDLGRCYFQVEYYDKAFSYYQKAYEIFEELEAESSIGSTLVNLANIFNQTDQRSEALAYYEKAADVLKKAEEHIDYANALNNIAATYVRMNNYPLALETHKKALAIYEQEDSSKLKAYSLYNIGNLYRNMKEYKNSNLYYEKSLSLFEENNYPKGIAICTIGLAENYVLQKQFNEAYEYILIAEENAKLLEIPQYKLTIHNLFVHYYYGIGEYKKAIDEFSSGKDINDDILHKKHDAKLIEMKTKFQIDQKIRQIELLEKDKSINRLRLLALLIALVGFAGIAILYRYRFIEKSKANKIIQKHEKELETSNEEQKHLLAELEELNLTKNKLFSILAHDLKNGFTALMKGTKLLSERIHLLDEKTVPVIAEELHKSSVTMYEMLQNLIVWGQLQSNRIEVHPRTLLLQEKVESISKLLAPIADEKGIQIEQSIPADVKVFADSASLLSILQNLIHNALKFTEDGGKITIHCEKEKKFIRIFVTDTGKGIKKEDQKAVFNLSKMHRSRGTKGEKGTGLGLLICKEFAEKNQGTLTFESEYGKGTTFILTLLNPEKE